MASESRTWGCVGREILGSNPHETYRGCKSRNTSLGTNPAGSNKHYCMRDFSMRKYLRTVCQDVWIQS